MVVSKMLTIKTSGDCDIVDITSYVANMAAGAGIHSGTVTVFITGSTAGVTTIEYEPGLIADLKAAWERIAPQGIEYKHNQAWGDGNGHAHVRASLLGPSLVIPFVDKKLVLGTWQQIVVIDFDNRARSRQVFIQIMGE